jgi:hypothetical protein
MLKGMLQNAPKGTGHEQAELAEELQAEKQRADDLSDELRRLREDLPSAREYSNF